RGRRAVSLGDLAKRGAAVAAQREEGNEDDAFAGAVVDDVVVPALGEVVLVLDGDDRHDPSTPFDLVDPDLGEADVPDLPAVAVLLDRAQALLERCLRVDPVQVVERDAVRPETAQAFLDLSPEHLGTPFPWAEPALRRYDAPLRDGRKCSTDRLLALSSGVRVGRVDDVHPGGDRLLHELHVLARVRKAIRPEPDPGHLGVAQPQHQVILADGAWTASGREQPADATTGSTRRIRGGSRPPSGVR